MPLLAGLGAICLAAGVYMISREWIKVEPTAEPLGVGFLLVGIGTALLDVALSS